VVLLCTRNRKIFQRNFWNLWSFFSHVWKLILEKCQCGCERDIFIVDIFGEIKSWSLEKVKRIKCGELKSKILQEMGIILLRYGLKRGFKALRGILYFLDRQLINELFSLVGMRILPWNEWNFLLSFSKSFSWEKVWKRKYVFKPLLFLNFGFLFRGSKEKETKKNFGKKAYFYFLEFGMKNGFFSF